MVRKEKTEVNQIQFDWAKTINKTIGASTNAWFFKADEGTEGGVKQICVCDRSKMLY